MGFIGTHSAHFSKPYKRLMGTPCSWREYVADGTSAEIPREAAGSSDLQRCGRISNCPKLSATASRSKCPPLSQCRWKESILNRMAHRDRADGTMLDYWKRQSVLLHTRPRNL